MPRGRPRKHPLPEDAAGAGSPKKKEATASTTAASSSSSSSSNGSSSDAAVPPKRPRGRPRKNPLPDSSSSSSSSNEAAAKPKPPSSPSPSPPSYAAAASGSSGSSGSSSGSLPSAASEAVGSGGAGVAGVGGGGVRWALALVVVALFPRAVAGTLRRLTGGGGAVADAAGTQRRRGLLAAFQQGFPPGGGNGDGKGGPSLWASLGKLLVAGGARAAVAGAVASLAVGVSIAPPGTFQLYQTVGQIPSSAFRENVILSGRVVRVSDGDTMRVRHTPLYPLIGNAPETGRLTDETLIIRLAGIDAPEVAKKDAPGQPFSQESKQFVADRVLNKQVRVKLLSRDQYARAVCSVTYPGPFWPLRRDLSEELVKEGLAVIYRQKGAQYDGKLSYLESLEAQAKAQRKGIWSKGHQAETPAQYKARLKKDEMERFLAPSGA